METTWRVGARAMQALQGQCLLSLLAPTTPARAQRSCVQQMPMEARFLVDVPALLATQDRLQPSQTEDSTVDRARQYFVQRTLLARVFLPVALVMLGTLGQCPP